MWRRGVILMFLCAGIVLDACGDETFSSNGNSDGGVDGSSSDGGSDASTDAEVTSDGGSNDAGGTIVLIDNQDNPHELIVQNAHLYWTNYSEALARGSVCGARIDGTNVTTIGTATHANRLASDGASVFWSDYVSDTLISSVLAAAPLDGGAAGTLVGNLVSPMGIAVDDQFIYLVEYYGFGGDGTITVFTKDGSSVRILASGLDNPVSVSVDAHGVVWTQLGFTPASGQIVATDLDGGVTGLADNLTGAWGVAITNSSAYVTQIDAPDASSGGSISSFARVNGTTQLITNASAARPYFITADAKNIYWTEEGDGLANGGVRWASQTGGAVHDLATGQARPHGIAVDGAYVYWTSYSSGKIYRTPKP
jgi:hypothetical protein